MSERDKKGRFLLGNPGNPNAPGRPPRAVEAEYLEVTVGAVPVATWKRIVKKAVAQALAGDAKAREWLGKLLGLEGNAVAAASAAITVGEQWTDLERAEAICALLARCGYRIVGGPPGRGAETPGATDAAALPRDDGALTDDVLPLDLSPPDKQAFGGDGRPDRPRGPWPR